MPSAVQAHLSPDKHNVVLVDDVGNEQTVDKATFLFDYWGTEHNMFEFSVYEHNDGVAVLHEPTFNLYAQLSIEPTSGNGNEEMTNTNSQTITGPAPVYLSNPMSARDNTVGWWLFERQYRVE